MVVGSGEQDKRLYKPARGFLRFTIPDGGSGGAGQNIAEREQKNSLITQVTVVGISIKKNFMAKDGGNSKNLEGQVANGRSFKDEGFAGPEYKSVYFFNQNSNRGSWKKLSAHCCR